MRIYRACKALALVALWGLSGCSTTIEAVKDPRYRVSLDSCGIGDIVTQDPKGAVKCIAYAPVLPSHAACTDWPTKPPRQQQRDIVNSMSGGDAPVSTKRDKLGADLQSRVNVVNQGQVHIVQGTVDAGLDVQSFQVGVHMDHLDLSIDISGGQVVLLQNEIKCLQSQKGDELRAGLASDLKVIGFVRATTLGFSQMLNLTSAEVKAVPGVNVIKLSASAFSLSESTIGRIDLSYVEDLRNLLNNLTGVEAAINATKLTLASPRVYGAEPILVQVEPVTQ